MRVDEEVAPYLIGVGVGVSAYVLALPLLGIPPGFAPFALRSLGVLLIGMVLGFVVADRYFDPNTERP